MVERRDSERRTRARIEAQGWARDKESIVSTASTTRSQTLMAEIVLLQRLSKWNGQRKEAMERTMEWKAESAMNKNIGTLWHLRWTIKLDCRWTCSRLMWTSVSRAQAWRNVPTSSWQDLTPALLNDSINEHLKHLHPGNHMINIINHMNNISNWGNLCHNKALHHGWPWLIYIWRQSLSQCELGPSLVFILRKYCDNVTLYHGWPWL